MTEARVDGREGSLGAAPGEPPRRGPGRAPRQPRDVVSDERIAAEREGNDREFTEDREMTEDERLELFRDSLIQSVLPDLPAMPGFHVFWATTTNARDSISWRIRIGYRPIRAEDCPGWQGVTISSGEYAGVIAVNEMLAMRIPLSLYNRYMREVHHNMPLAEQEKIRAQIRNVSNDAARRGSKVTEGDGMAELGRRVAPPPEFVQ
jgi:hypothetical protein